MRYEWKAFIVAEADTEDQAREQVEDLTYAANKNPDGAHVYLDDGPPVVEDGEETP